MEELQINSTNQQAQASLRVCQMLSNYYRDIKLFHFDSTIGEVYILARDNIQVIIPANGHWRFIQ
ncbi:hypothetical protein C7B64_22160 [Merismopedia glauca CCAP 1448/3]|uniref:DUF6888 domain-containing protein n=1 Tax=Merismopedia glauca CCAP 1448/3 TaxID=1296344 RepID=A0A2T1BXQ4_9CYAN|nr:hypothetical protein C7B64_22160 [Merismopedia glauca CCAP 1448/3]